MASGLPTIAVADDPQSDISADSSAPGSTPQGQALLDQLARETDAQDSARQAELQSADAEAERQRSRIAYAGLSDGDAASLLREQFSRFLDSRQVDPSELVPPSEVVKYLSDTSARIDGGPGQPDQIVESTIPLRARTDSGQKAPVDLSLDRQGTAYAPANPLADISVPVDIGDGIDLPDANVAVEAPSAPANPAPARILDGDTAFYPNIATDTDLVAMPTAEGLEALVQLRSADSPEVIALDLNLPAGADLQETPGGGAAVVKDGKPILAVPAPIGIDAQGQDVKTSLRVDGSALKLVTDHRGADYAYPILIDPTMTFPEATWAWYQTVNQTGLNYWTSWTNATPGKYVMAKTCDPANGQTCYGYAQANNHGLYVYAKPGFTYSVTATGEWYYTAPGSAFIHDLYMNDTYFARHGDGQGDPRLFGGIWSPSYGNWTGTENWTGPQSDQNLHVYPGLHSSGVPENTGTQVAVGLRANNQVNLSYYHDAYVGGTAITLGDDWPPTVVSPGTAPSSWIDNGQKTLNPQLRDQGLGLIAASLTVPTDNNGGQSTQTVTDTCTGASAAPCVADTTITLPYTTAPHNLTALTYDAGALPEGYQKLTVDAKDPSGQWASAAQAASQRQITAKVDHSAPTISETGTLKDKAGQQINGSFGLSVHATDGSTQDNTTQRSGVASISVKVDGTEKASATQTCSTSTDSCSLDLSNFSFNTADYSEAQHTISVTATDRAGHVSPADSWTVTVDRTAPDSSIDSGPSGPTSNNQPTFAFSANESGSTFQCSIDQGTANFGPCSGPGASHTPSSALADGSYTFRVKASDPAGNSDDSPATRDFTVDTTKPAKPTLSSTAPASPANDNSPKILGSAESGSTVKLYTTSDCSGSAAGTGSAASFTSPGIAVSVADDSSTSYHATATDAAGNVSDCSTSAVTYSEDSTKPAKPTLSSTAPASPANDNSPKILGSAESGSTVKLYTTSDCSGSAAGTGSAASFTSPGIAVSVADDSSTSYHATATDAAGNVSDCSTSAVTYSEDSTKPAKPTLSSTAPASPANDNSPKILGSAESGSTVKLYTTSDCSGSAAGTGSAASFTSPGIAVSVADDSSTSYHATAIDAAGNVSDCSTSAVTYSEDSTPPQTTITSGPSGNTPPTPAFAYSSTESGSTFQCRIDTDPFAACPSDGYTTPYLAEGPHTFYVKATDPVGNVDPTPATRSFTVDRELPSTITGNTTLHSGDPYTGDSVTIPVGVTVTVDPGATVKLSGALTVNGTLDVQGTGASPALFTSSANSSSCQSPGVGQWTGIDLHSSSSTLDHAEVRYATNGVTVTGTVSPSITNSNVHDNCQVGVKVANDGSPLISGNTVQSNGDRGIYLANGGNGDVAGNTVTDNGANGIAYTACCAQQGQVKIHDNVVRNNVGDGINVSQPVNASWNVQGQTLSGNTVTDNGGKAIVYSSASGSLPADIDENPVPTGNGSNAIWLRGHVAQSTTWSDHGYPLVVMAQYGVAVESGATLTLSPGVVLKGEYGASSFFDVAGALNAQGTAANRIVLSSIRDDSVDGDTNGDGSATSPAPGDWGGLAIESSTANSTLDHVEVRYGTDGISLTGGASPTITHSTVRDNAWDGIRGGSPQITDDTIEDNGLLGIYVDGGGSQEIARNTVVDNGGTGIAYTPCCAQQGVVRIDDNVVRGNQGDGINVSQAFGGYWNVDGGTLAGNTVTDNSGKAIVYSSATGSLPPDIDENADLTGNGSNAVWLRGDVAQNTTWSDHGYPLVLMPQYGVRVESAATLTLSPGLVVKGDYGTSSFLDVLGALDAEGTPANPITFTSTRDDAIGGDTNSDGSATQPAAGDWGGIAIDAASAHGVIDYANIANAVEGFQVISCSGGCATPSTVRHSRFTNNTIGVYANEQPSLVTWSSFHGNTMAITKNGAVTAEPNNDYGSASGPKPYGSGDPVGSAIDPFPWNFLRSAFGALQGLSSQGGLHLDPVVVSTGQLVNAHTDLRLTGKSLPLQFTRVYNSGDPSDAGLGPGWSHSGLISAIELESGDVVVRRADGRQDTFTKTQSVYTAPSGVHDTLTKNQDGTYSLTTLDRTVYAFNRSGRIATITDDHGLVTTYGYDSGGRLVSITDPSGQQLSFGYDSSNHITDITDSTGRHVHFNYSPSGDLVKATNALGGETEYAYDTQNRLTSITDPRGHTILTNTYDGQGRIIAQRDGLNHLWSADYSSGQTAVTAPEGGTATYGFDGQGRLISEADALGHTTSYGYDSQGNINSVHRPGGADWSLSYDTAGNLSSATDPGGGVRAYAYDGHNRLTSYTDPRNKTWTYGWSNANDLTSISDPASNTTTLTHNGAGQPLTITDANNHTTSYAYDSRGNLASLTDPLGHTTSYGYDSDNYLTSRAQPGLSAETFIRSALGDLLSRTTPDGNTTSYDYDANGILASMTDPGGNLWQIERNAAEFPTAYVDPLGHRTEISYNGDFKPTLVTDRRSEETHYSYDLADRLTQIQRPEGDSWQFAYDGRGNRTTVTDPRGHTTDYQYDLLDRLTEADEPLSTVSSYGYDPAGNLTSVSDPRGHETDFAYDALGRMTEVDQPLGKTTAFTYDGVGNRLTRTTALGSLSYAYDAADRLASISNGASVLRAYGYDDANRLLSATDADHQATTFGYDDDGNVTTLDDGRGQTVARGFDSRGDLTSQIDGRGALSFGYDAAGRMTSLTDPESQNLGFTYDPEGNLTEADLPNGAATTNSYDDDGRLTATTSQTGSTTLQSFTYTYDAAGNRTAQTDRLGAQTGYIYDALNRLTEFDPPSAPAVSYGYDGAGNRTTVGGTSYSYNALNQLTASSEGTSYSYDGAGRLSQKSNGSQTTTYGWNPLDELVSVDDGSQTTTYSYDGLGRRSERSQGPSLESAHYGDLGDLPILDTDSSGQIVQTYVQGPTGLAEERADSQTSFPLADVHGDITTMSDASGAVSSRQSYDPWGTQLAGPTQAMGYLGSYERRSDPSTGLVQMGARAYDPSLGHFTSEDPVLGHPGLGQSNDRYGYVWDNPLNVYDLDGQSPCPPASLTPPFAEDACKWTTKAISNTGAWLVNAGNQGMTWGVNTLNPILNVACPLSPPGLSPITALCASRYPGYVEDVSSFALNSPLYKFAARNAAVCVEAGGIAAGVVGVYALAFAPSEPLATPTAAVLGCAAGVGANEGLSRLAGL